MAQINLFDRLQRKHAEIIKNEPELLEAYSKTLGALVILSQISDLEQQPNQATSSNIDLVTLKTLVSRALADALIIFDSYNIANAFFHLNGVRPSLPIAHFSNLTAALAQGYEIGAHLPYKKDHLPNLDLLANRVLTTAQLVDNVDTATRALVPGEDDDEISKLLPLLFSHFLKFDKDVGNLLRSVDALGFPPQLFFDVISDKVDETMEQFVPYNGQTFISFLIGAEGYGEWFYPPEITTMNNVYVGIVARSRAGKSLAVSTLTEEFGFRAESLSSVLRLMLAVSGASEPFSREQLIEAGKEYKHLLGGGTLIQGMENIFAEPGKDQLFCFDGLRNLEEWQTMKKIAAARNGQAILISIETGDYSNTDQEKALDIDQRIRFERALAAGHAKDPKSEDEFEAWKAIDDGERIGIDAVAAHASHVVINEPGKEGETVEELTRIFEAFVE